MIRAIKFKYQPDQIKVKLTASVAEENFTVVGYYAPSSGNFLLTFQDNLLGPSSRDETDRLSRNVSKKLLLLALYNYSEVRSSHPLYSRSLKSCIARVQL